MSISNENGAKSRKGRRLALVVGVNGAPNYRKPALKYADADANAVAKVLREYGRFEILGSSPLLNEQAGSSAIADAIVKLTANRERDDVLLFYFSGHGQQVISGPNRNNSTAYLVTADFNPAVLEHGLNVHISMQKLREALFTFDREGKRAGTVVIILDCCYSEDVRTLSDPQWEQVQGILEEMFAIPGAERGARQSGISVALAASRYDEVAGEKDGHGIMTRVLLEVLEGKVERYLGDEGQIDLDDVLSHVKRTLQQKQPPAVQTNDSLGGCIIAWNKERAADLLRGRERQVRSRPESYIPLVRDHTFHLRPGELAQIEQLLDEARAARSSVDTGLCGVGLEGMIGVGKTSVAVELAHSHEEHAKNTTFWMPATGRTFPDLQAQFARLAEVTDYLPDGDNPAYPEENEGRRARHICRYLADQPDVLLVLDHIEDPNVALSTFCELAGRTVRCTVLYTSRETDPPTRFTIKIRRISRLSVEDALQVLLGTARKDLLTSALAGEKGSEEEAARAVCEHVQGLPALLAVLKKFLEEDSNLSLGYLYEQLIARGTLDIVGLDQGEDRAEAVISLSWDRVSPRTKLIFKLASYFPEAAPIPLWLLAAAAGLDERGMTAIDPLGNAISELKKSNLLEILPDNQVFLVGLLRDFGRREVHKDGKEGQELLLHAQQRITAAYTDLTKLEKLARGMGYWRCLERLRAAREYAALLDPAGAKLLERMEYWLARETYLLGNEAVWPAVLPQMFYQQIFNRAVEKDYTLSWEDEPTRWLKQLNQVGIEDQGQLRLLEHPEPVKAVAFSPDGGKVVTGGVDWVARIWDASNGRELLPLRGHTSAVTSVTFSWDSHLIVTGSSDATTRVWDADNGQELRRLDGYAGAVEGVSLSPDIGLLSTASDGAEVHLWDMKNGRSLDTLQAPFFRLTSVAWSPNGRLLAAGGRDGSVCVWNAESRTLEWNLPEGGRGYEARVAWTADGKRLAAADSEGVRLWDLEEAAARQALFQPQEAVTLATPGATCVACSPDRQRIAVGSTDETIYLWDIAVPTPRVLRILSGHTDEITSVAFSPDGKRLITGSEDRTARIWDITDKQEVVEKGPRHQHEIKRIAFSPGGSRAVTGAIGGSIWLWNVANGEVREKAENGYIGDVAFSPDGGHILIGGYGELQIWDVGGGSAILRLEHQEQLPQMDQVNAVCYSPDGSKVATGSFDKLGRIWDVRSGALHAVLSGHTRAIERITFSPGGTRIATGATDGTARLWDVGRLTGEGGERQPIAVLRGHRGLVTSLCFSSDGSKLVTGALDGKVRIWDITREASLLKTLQKYGDSIVSLAVSPDGRYLATGDERGRVLLWRLEAQGNGRVLGMFIASHEVRAILWLDAGSLLLADSGGRLRPHFYRLALVGDW